MTLVDSSVWIDHLRSGVPKLADLLSHGLVLGHPFIIGELACGNLRDRARILGDLSALPTAMVARDEEVMHFIDDRKLWGKDVGWLDCHLLSSALVTGCAFWTTDKRLAGVIGQIGIPRT